jgi:hypothetical protein
MGPVTSGSRGDGDAHVVVFPARVDWTVLENHPRTLEHEGRRVWRLVDVIRSITTMTLPDLPPECRWPAADLACPLADGVDSQRAGRSDPGLMSILRDSPELEHLRHLGRSAATGETTLTVKAAKSWSWSIRRGTT